MLIWSDQYSTGSSVLDEQHRQLFQHCNQFRGMLEKVVTTKPTSRDIDAVSQFLDFLQHFVDTHFSYEERCMDSYRCPAHQKNKDAHEIFRQKFKLFKARSEKEGFPVPMLVELDETVEDWIKNHILHVDTQLKPCIAEHVGLQK